MDFLSNPNGVRIALAFLLALVCLPAQSAVKAKAGAYRLELATEPRVIALGQVKLKIRITDAGGKPLDGLKVQAIARMPGMNMGEREGTARPSPGSEGTYELFQPFSMQGAWEVHVRINGPQGEESTSLSLRTGQDTGDSAASGFSPTSLLPWVVAAAMIVFVLYRVRRTGQRLELKSVLNGATLSGLALLAVLLIGAFWAVNNLRRKGAMSPLEAQGMEMNTPPPPGTTPVSLALVETGEVTESVAYSGQAVGYVEQDVVPRVTGTIVAMPVYVGDRVNKGQTLARLDTSQLDPEVAEKAAMADVASRSVDVAASEHRASLQMVAEARADLTVRMAAVEEAEAMRLAAVQERAALREAVTVADARVSNAKSEIESEEKNQEFWQAEVKRARELYERGVVARANLQRAEAEAARAQNQLHHAHTLLDQALADRSAALANLARSESLIAAAEKRVKQAQADVAVARATIRSRESEADAKKRAISREQASVAQAQAGYRGAATMRSYTELKSEVDGVVTRRLISPGTVVSPGQAVLQVAQVAPIRLQANVAEADRARIRVGTPVTIEGRTGSGAIRSRVTSIAPAVDATSRTAAVEVLYHNRDGRFAPGQFVTLRFEIGASLKGLRVPTAALRPPLDQDRFQASLWIASPGQSEGEFTVRRIEVEVAAQGARFASVRSPDLAEGQRVVVQGGATLQEGDVVSAAVSKAESEGPSVAVSASGFDPPTIEVAAGQSTTITFTRISEEGCGTEVVFPDLGINQPLPLNKPVQVTIHPKTAGTYSFACGMDMLRGKVVAR